MNQRYKLPDIQVATFARDTKPNATPGEVILLTSGTTGFASGCVFTLEQLLLNAQRHADSIGQREGDIVLLNLPLHYSFALVAQALTTLVMGGRLVVTGPPFHVPSYLEAIDKHGVTISSLTPVLVRSLLQNSTSFPPSLRVLTVGGDVLGRQHVKELLKRRPGRELYLTYGLTQAGPRVSTLAAHREPGRRFESVGLPIAGTHVQLEDLHDGMGRKQLLVGSETVMRRRVGAMDSSRSSEWRGPGTIATNDIFEQDDDGYLYFKGRLGDFIVRAGEKLCLAAVRRVASELPQVLRAKTNVIGKPNGECDYSLTLTIEPLSGLRADDHRRALGRRLRRCEMPSKIQIECDNDANNLHYK